MSVKKREGSPHYWYDFTVGGMRFRGSCETNDIATAKAVEAQLRTDAVLNKHLQRKPRLTLDAAFAKYWKEHGQFTSSGLQSTRYMLKEMLNFFGRNLYFDDLEDSHINNYISHLQARPQKNRLANASINRRIDMLRAVIMRARKRWGVETPDISISNHRLIAAEARTRWITAAEADHLIAAADDHLKPIIRCALLTGLRRGNILGLRWEQVNMQARVITFRVKSKLPGGKLLEIPISDALFSLLAEQNPKKIGFVFLRHFKLCPKTGKQRKPQPLLKIQKSFRYACKQAGIHDFRFHDLRHTAASWMLQQGVTLDVVQQILGHANISQTQKYAHRQASDRQAAMNALAAAQSPSNPKKKEAAA